MIEAVVLVPVTDNDGALFPASAWRTLEQRLLQFGGFSVREGVRGAWRGEERVYHDRLVEYTTSLTSWNQFPKWLIVVRWAKTQFRQEAIYIRVAGVPDIL